MIKFTDIKGRSLLYVINYITHNTNMRFWDCIERACHFKEAEFILTAAGITVDAVYILFNEKEKAVAIRYNLAS